jgi:lysozyme
MGDPKPLFDAMRAILRRHTGNKLTGLAQRDVDEINRALAGMTETVTPPDIVVTATRPGLKPSQKGIDLIHSFESCELEAYPDPGSADGNPWTIGWGSTGPDIGRGTVWTQRQADERFAADLEKFSAGVRKLVDGGAATSQNEFDALTSIAYNIGLAALSRSTLLRLHRAGDKEGAAGQFGVWVYNDGKKMNGLVRRRAAEAALYRGAA